VAGFSRGSVPICSGSGRVMTTLRRSARRLGLMGDSEMCMSVNLSLIDRAFFRGDPALTPTSDIV
jgi:hypothetical protein